jgi:hypothetical protein
MNAFFLKEFIKTIKIGETNNMEIRVKNIVAKIPLVLFFIIAVPPCS